ncbi:serine/threonine-protein kinase [Streptomyces sp. NPDC087769]|uniref:serine/threonine-protein kinase n=1 Tax=unclassified Streptomyces TaxID=2593676 RepID=UPI000F5BA1D8|nr:MULTISPECIES: serine/threonine-protein kinase [unclassified Streptomyces]WSG51146.1 serine/threonine protein kinase [Streptomyces sp. NBC_01732]WSX01813.1 serine/threonine protein kinase [Streptomyces sp. NBC_00987]MCX4396296.1 serine/threonine protein kinase [Streptomyces sp. NBC_01767]RPK56673.1 Serine/threonine-protein kinase PrkC [Streptomyces sp. ADI95-17]WSC29890.1 serine/threonine protein kinase [Streptomyces sp. NBC_01768]
MRPVGSKYLLEEPLGRGATGTVWRARQRETAGAEAAVAGEPGETVAIKVLKEELANDADVVMRFLRERSVLLRLTHENIVRTRDLVVEGDLLALVMDLIDGPDLHRYLRENGPLTPVAAALLTAQIADALAASHADGVVHRDLKPANVLLDERDGQMRPMLTDFGIARLADSPGLTRTHEFVGTPAYVAPESAEGRPQTSAVDIYGAGILLYELVTGRPPFAGGTALEVLHRHLSEEPRRPSNVPAPLWTVIERCLSKDPDRRPSAENLARGLRTVAAGIGVHASSAQIAAADGVGALLAPDPAPAAVPETPGAADPTQVLPSNAGSYDPNAATSVMQHAPGPGGHADPTSVMPPVPPRPDGAPEPDGPHPWQSQLQAARDRNEQTQVQYLDPGQDPLRRRPQRPQPQQQQPQRRQQPPPQQYQQPQQQYPQHRQQQYQPQPQQQPQRQQYAPPQQPAPQPPAPRQPREPRQRSANPMRIPGLGCLKGCLFTLVLLFVAGWLIWELTPLQDWIGQGKSYWKAIGDAISTVTDWISELGGGSDSGGGNTGP